MERQIIDISQEDQQLRKKRGCLEVCSRNEKHLVPFDEIEAIIVHAHQANFSNNLFIELAAQKIPLILCDHTHMPISWVWPIIGNYDQTRRMNQQSCLSDAEKGLIWQKIIRQKIYNQGALLNQLHGTGNGLIAMSDRVENADKTNLEAQAASRYWKLLFGQNFKRERGRPGQNALLNYGYIILRSAIARYVVAAGLHPSLGVHHRNQFNGFCLVDDLIEPFRPFIDQTVFFLSEEGFEDVCPETKSALVGSLSIEISWGEKKVPLSRAIELMVNDLVSFILQDRTTFLLPIYGDPP